MSQLLTYPQKMPTRTRETIKSTSLAASTFDLQLTEPEPFHSVSHKGILQRPSHKMNNARDQHPRVIISCGAVKNCFQQCVDLQPNQTGTTHVIGCSSLLKCCMHPNTGIQTQKLKVCISDVHRTLLVGACIKLVNQMDCRLMKGCSSTIQKTTADVMARTET